MEIIISIKAKSDINGLFEYIAQEYGTVETAAAAVIAIYDAIADIEPFPKRHKRWKDSDLRFFSVKNYLVFYHIDEAADKIEVVRVIYSRRNIEDLL